MGRKCGRMAVIQMRRKIYKCGTSVPAVAPAGSLLAVPHFSRIGQAQCSPAKVTVTGLSDGPQCSCSTLQHLSLNQQLLPSVQPKQQTLQCPSSSQNYLLFARSRCTKWYVPFLTNCLFTRLVPCPNKHRSLLTDAKGRRRPARGLGSPPLKFQKPPLLLQRRGWALKMGTTARNRHREAQDLHGGAPQLLGD